MINSLTVTVLKKIGVKSKNLKKNGNCGTVGRWNMKSNHFTQTLTINNTKDYIIDYILWIGGLLFSSCFWIVRKLLWYSISRFRTTCRPERFYNCTGQCGWHHVICMDSYCNISFSPKIQIYTNKHWCFKWRTS